MSKTPFEIRADILQMAERNLFQQYIANLEFSRTLMNKLMEQTELSNSYLSPEAMRKWAEEVSRELKSVFPLVPTPEEIMKQANELYAFVTKKTNDHNGSDYKLWRCI